MVKTHHFIMPIFYIPNSRLVTWAVYSSVHCSIPVYQHGQQVAHPTSFASLEHRFCR